MRSHVVWALGKIGGVQAQKVLERHLTTESSDKVKQEIHKVLEGNNGV